MNKKQEMLKFTAKINAIDIKRLQTATTKNHFLRMWAKQTFSHISKEKSACSCSFCVGSKFTRLLSVGWMPSHNYPAITFLLGCWLQSWMFFSRLFLSAWFRYCFNSASLTCMFLLILVLDVFLSSFSTFQMTGNLWLYVHACSWETLLAWWCWSCSLYFCSWRTLRNLSWSCVLTGSILRAQVLLFLLGIIPSTALPFQFKHAPSIFSTKCGWVIPLYCFCELFQAFLINLTY